MMIQLTDDMIEAGRSEQDGWSREQLRLFGVSWPPAKHWKRRMAGSQFDERVVEEFLRLKDAHLPKVRVTAYASAIQFPERCLRWSPQ